MGACARSERRGPEDRHPELTRIGVQRDVRGIDGPRGEDDRRHHANDCVRTAAQPYLLSQDVLASPEPLLPQRV